MGERRACFVPLRRLFRMAVVLSLSISLSFGVRGAVNDGFNDNVNRADPNFVTASLLLAGPGDELFSRAGHAFIRLECPEFKLDFCFSYESESVQNRLLTFFSGKLKMGLFAIPTTEFLKTYTASGRGVRQYKLNLLPDVKQRLWRLMDQKAAEGANLPYDYVARGCAWSVVNSLQEALKPVQMEVGPWPEKFEKSRREIAEIALKDYPWTRLFLQTFIGSELDSLKSSLEKVVMPVDLTEFLKRARVYGTPIIAGEGSELLPRTCSEERDIPISPVGLACVLFVVALLYFTIGKMYVAGPLLILQLGLSAFMTYLVCFSRLPCTHWNWLIVPFNLLPLIFWKWRAKWALGFVLVLLAWEVFMLVSPHRLTDSAYLVLVPAYMLIYLRFSPRVVSIFSPKRTRL